MSEWDKNAEHGENFWKQGDWDDLHDGQLIAAVWPSGARIGTLYDAGAGTLYLPLNESGNVSSVDSLREDGAALFVKATPPLPTEMYTAILAQVDGRLVRCILFLYGETWIDGNGNSVFRSDIKSFEVVAAPVAVTTKRVAEDFVAAILAKHDEKMGNTYSLHVSTLMEIAATFGVEA